VTNVDLCPQRVKLILFFSLSLSRLIATQNAEIVQALEDNFLMVPFVLRLSRPTDMTIHWKALEEHFLMVPLVFKIIKTY
jgi:hypothetical protein